MRVTIISDYKIVSEAIACLLRDIDVETVDVIACLGELSSGTCFDECDVIILIAPAFGNSVISNLQKIRDVSKNVAIILVSILRSPAIPLSLLFRYSVKGVLPIDCEVRDLYAAVRSACSGKTFITPADAQQMVLDLAKPQKRVTLSSREEEILVLIAQGMSTNEIAKQLSRSAKTISTHKTNIKNRLNLSSTSDIVRYAIGQGWLPGRFKG